MYSEGDWTPCAFNIEPCTCSSFIISTPLTSPYSPHTFSGILFSQQWRVIWSIWRWYIHTTPLITISTHSTVTPLTYLTLFSHPHSNDVLFEAFEDDIYAQNATAAYLFPSNVSTTNLVAALIPIASLKKCINSIRQLIPISTATTSKWLPDN